MIPAERAHLHVCAKSHPGMSGKNNEDRYAVSAYRLEGEKPLSSVFAIISDGIGGHRAGEVAAEMAVETISQAVATSDASQPVQSLKEGILNASEKIRLQAESDMEKSGMGATCACAWIIGEQLYIASVGDSRVYLLRGDGITQLSTDHTWVQEAIQAGIVDPEQAREHPNAHVIRRYLGSKQLVEPDLRLRLSEDESIAQAEANQGLLLLPEDQVFLCSDGLTDLVEANEILTSLRSKNQSEALDELINLANQRGGHDNITLISLQVPAALPQTVPVERPQPKRRRGLACVSISVVALLIASILAGAVYLYLMQPVTAGATPTNTNTVVPTQEVITPTGELSPPEAVPSLSSTPLPPQDSTPTDGPVLISPAATLTFWPTNTSAP